MSVSFYQSPYDFQKLKAAHPNGRERGALYAFAKASERSERWEDCVRGMRELVRTLYTSPNPIPPNLPSSPGPPAAGGDAFDLTDEERQTFFLGYKHLLGGLRTAWRGIRFEESHIFGDLLNEYRQSLEAQMILICTDATNLVENTLLKGVTKTESRIFFTKFAGDLYRYLSELNAPGSPEKRAAEMYQSAFRLASLSLEPTHPTRLGVSLNWSVCLCEILKDKKQACELAKNAFDQAIAKLDDLEEHSYKDSTLLMQLLRDNLTLWTQDAE